MPRTLLAPALGAAITLGCGPTDAPPAPSSASPPHAASAPSPRQDASSRAGPNCAGCAGTAYHGDGHCLRIGGLDAGAFAPIPVPSEVPAMPTAVPFVPGHEPEACDSRCCPQLVPARWAHCGRPAGLRRYDDRRHLDAPWLPPDKTPGAAQTGAWLCWLGTRQGEGRRPSLPTTAGAEMFERRRVLVEGTTRDEDLLWSYLDPAWATRVAAALPELDALAIRGARAEVAARCQALWAGEQEHAATRTVVERAAEAYVASGAVPEGAIALDRAPTGSAPRARPGAIERAAARCGWTPLR